MPLYITIARGLLGYLLPQFALVGVFISLAIVVLRGVGLILKGKAWADLALVLIIRKLLPVNINLTLGAVVLAVGLVVLLLAAGGVRA